MDDLLQATEDGKTQAMEIGALISDHKGADVLILDMRSLNFWTDFFVIATVTSSVHLSGLERHIKEYSRDRGIDTRHSGRTDTENEWFIIDLGNIVIHLMSEKSRSFYELERLWSTAPRKNL